MELAEMSGRGWENVVFSATEEATKDATSKVEIEMSAGAALDAEVNVNKSEFFRGPTLTAAGGMSGEKGRENAGRNNGKFQRKLAAGNSDFSVQFRRQDSNAKDDNRNARLSGRTVNDYRLLQDGLPAGLELYDVVAKRRILNDDNLLESIYDLTRTDLRTDLSCPICMSILQDTVVAKNCLHRFCTACIEKCVRIGIRECPQCRNHVSSRRSLRSDPIFDLLVHRLFPNVKIFEEENAVLLAEANKRLSRSFECSSSANIYFDPERPVTVGSATDSPSRGLPLAALHGVYVNEDGTAQERDEIFKVQLGGEQRGQTEQKLTKAERRRKRREIESQMRKIPSDGLLHFEIVPDPDLPHLPLFPDNNHLATSGSVTIEQLRRYISAVLKLDQSSIKFYTKEHRSAFDEFSSLAYVHIRSYGLSHQTIVLYYTTSNTKTGGGGVFPGIRGYFAPCTPKLHISASTEMAAIKSIENQCVS